MNEKGRETLRMRDKERGIALLVAAPSSGSGKTTVSCGLMEIFLRRGYCVEAFKCGPDYIDPMYHREVIGVPSRNLDTYFSDEEQIRRNFQYQAGRNCCSEGNGLTEEKLMPDADSFLKEKENKTKATSVISSVTVELDEEKEQKTIRIVEGVMGLYDGLGRVGGEGSSYHLAQILDIPILLVFDARGMGQTILPILSGIRQFDRDNRIIGVVLNRTSRSFGERLAPLIEKELGLPVLGIMPNEKEFDLKSRHLGLKLPGEQGDCREQLKRVADRLEENLDIEHLCLLMEETVEAEATIKTDESAGSGKITGSEEARSEKTIGSEEAGSEKTIGSEEAGSGKITGPEEEKESGERSRGRVRIAVARDEAFCFYYEENLQLLREYGAELVFFSPIHDRKIPEGTCGLLLGGGYPELYLGKLAENMDMKQSIREGAAMGMTIVAECGGFLYLHEQVCDDQGCAYPMVGLIRAVAKNQGRLVRFGYVSIREKQAEFLEDNTCIRGHEFHYYDSSDNGTGCLAHKPSGQNTNSCIHSGECFWWGFPHLYYPSNPSFAERFVRKCRSWKDFKGESYTSDQVTGRAELGRMLQEPCKLVSESQK